MLSKSKLMNMRSTDFRLEIFGMKVNRCENSARHRSTYLSEKDQNMQPRTTTGTRPHIRFHKIIKVIELDEENIILALSPLNLPIKKFLQRS